MKYLSILSFVILMIAGCAGGYTQQTNARLQQAAQTEMAAWEKVQTLYDEQCPHSTDSKQLPKEKAVESADCYEKYARQHVIPVVFDPLSASSLLTEYKQNAIDLKNGKIDRDQARLNNQKAWNVYMQKISGKADQIQMQAYQADVQATQRTQQALQNMSQQLNSSSGEAGECGSISIAPIASPGCKNICINGRWSEVC